MLNHTAITAAIRRAADDNRRTELRDQGEPGLTLRINPGGKLASWSLRCLDTERRPRRFLIGTYPALGLAAARAACRQVREQVNAGIYPLTKPDGARATGRETPAEARDTARAYLMLAKRAAELGLRREATRLQKQGLEWLNRAATLGFSVNV